MNEEITKLLKVFRDACKLEREVWKEIDSICEDWHIKNNAPKGYTFSAYLDSSEAKTWRKKWNASKRTVNIARNCLEYTIRAIHHELTLDDNFS